MSGFDHALITVLCIVCIILVRILMLVGNDVSGTPRGFTWRLGGLIALMAVVAIGNWWL